MTSGEDRTLGLVLDFLNTMDVETGTDALADWAAFDAWLRAHRLPGPADLDAARRFRTLLRSAVGESRTESQDAAAAPSTALPDAARRPDAAAAPSAPGVLVSVTLGADGRPTLSSPDPLGQIAAAAVRLADDGRWDRVKICTADDCRWAFYDRSKNHSRHWCSMDVCGNRAKSRAFRDRHRAPLPSG